MKIIKKIIVLLFIISFKISTAQYSAFFNIKVFIDSTSTPMIKKYGVKMSFDGYPNPLQFVVRDPATGNVFYGDSIPDLIRDTSNVPKYPFKCYAIDLIYYPDTMAYAEIVPNQKSMDFVSFIPNSIGNCDGHVNFNIDTVGKHFPYPVTDIRLLHIVGPGQAQGTLLSIGNNNFDTLCPGYYYFLLTIESPGIQGTAWYYEKYPFTINWPLHPSSNTQLIVNPYATTAIDTCLGKAYVSPIGGTPPYTYSYDGGPFSSADSVTNLCSGFHTVNALDFMGISTSAYFIINVDSTVYNNPIPTSQVIDTIICNYGNCNFDYSVPVDSAYLLNYIVIDTNTIFFTWKIWQSGTSVVVSDTVSYLYQPGTNMVTLIMFCGNAKMQVSSKFKTIRVNDYADLNVWSALSVTQNDKLSNLYFYPNPFNDELFVDLNNKEINFKGLWNSLGQKLEIENSNDGKKIKINTKNLPKGIYFISIQEKNQAPAIKKITK